MTEKNLASKFFLGGALLAVLGFVVYAETDQPLDDPTTDPQDNSSQLLLDEKDKDVNLPVYAPSSYWIGVRVVPVPDILLSHFGVKDSNSGLVVVEQVVENSPASKAGLKRGDVILQYGEKKVQTLDDLVQEIAVGEDSVQKLKIIRDGEKTELSVKPEARPAEPLAMLGRPLPQGFSSGMMPGMLPPGMMPRGLFQGRIPGRGSAAANVPSDQDPDDLSAADPMTPSDMKLGREIWLGARDPRQMMREMEEYFRQMQGGHDADQLLLLPETDQLTDKLADGSAKRLEVTSRTDKDGKTKIKITQVYKTGDDTEEKTWEVENLDDLPEEIRGEVKALFGR